LAQCFHFLGLYQHLVRAALLGDVEGQLEAANHLASLCHLGYQGGLKQAFVTTQRHGLVFKRHAFAAQRLLDEWLDACVGVNAKELACADLFGAVGVHTKPVLVAAVDVTVHQRGIEIRHQSRNGVGDEAHLRLAALQ
jgi:hypothetical protein